ncbi:DUF421 domain-containing protein [Ornithinimicrobium pekingense]|uniref:DUF421 domain-containing protein n=1 Tax=Ornithinimicrobium pekingense TaxID=384677 RepID=A0ABQ2F6C2_9MICO|nr:YetF domain-containing protein [Ornithinimicrobium pekingense]GGK66467.1 DUF421 domain-containing protein [Ornithinimicrobium pekingense]
MWFDSWSAVLRIVLVGAASYAALVLLLRLVGKRLLAKLNAFDLVVTVALGSVLATAVLSKDVRYVDAVAGMALLVAAQWVVTRVTTWLPGGRWFVNAEPTLVVARGEVLEHALTRARLTRGEVLQAVRSSGQGGLQDVAAVVLEPDGTLSVVTRSSAGDERALAEVPGWA